FKDCFDDHVNRGKIVIAECRLDESQALVDDLLGEAAALYRICVMLADRGHPAIERRLVCVLQHDRYAGVSKRHSYSAAHCSGAYDTNAVHRDQGSILGDVGDLGYLALAKEYVNHRLGLVREQAVRE